MKRLFYIFTMIAMVLGLSACQKAKKSESIRTGRCARGACEQGDNAANGGDPEQNGTATEASGDTKWGQIHKGTFTQAQFYIGVQGFVSANINPYDTPSDLGYVSGEQNDDTGIWFWGDVKTASGTFNPNANQNIELSKEDAELRIVVWDNMAGKADQNGVVIPEYPVHIIGAARGNVNGNTVTIQFQDNYGWVKLIGTYDKDYFTGEVFFDNKQFWDGEHHFGTYGRAGKLGSFTVPTCGFFNCQ